MCRADIMSFRDLAFLRLNEAPLKGLVPDLPMGRRIPKLLHQTYARRNLTDVLWRNLEAIRMMNPGWICQFYDDDDCQSYIREEYGQTILDYYLRINEEYGAARADLFRYLLLYKEGGVYLDVKTGVDRPFDEVLRPDDRYLLSHWKNGRNSLFANWGIHPELSHIERGEFQQWFIVAVPGHPFLKAVIETVLGNIDRYVPGIHRTGAHAVFRVTGPIAYSLAIAPLLDKAPYRLVDSENDLGLSYSIFSHIEPQQHKEVLKSHYADKTTSLIDVGPHKMAAFAVYRGIAGIYKSAFHPQPPTP